MPPKHPLLFSALALVLAILLLNASIIEVSAIEPVTIGLIVGLVITGGLAIYFGWNYLQAKGEQPGVNLDSYVLTVADSWKTSLQNLINTVRNYATLVHQGKLLYARYAEYEAKNFVDKQNLDQVEDQVMFNVAFDLYQLKRSADEGIEYFANDLAYFAKNRLTGDLEQYDIRTNINLRSLKHASDIYLVYALDSGKSITAWIWGSVTLSVDSYISCSAYGTFTLTPIAVSQQSNAITVNVSCDDWITTSVTAGIWRISYSGSSTGLIRALDLFPIADIGNIQVRIAGKFGSIIQATNDLVIILKNRSESVGLSRLYSDYLNLINNIDATYDAAYSYAKAMHQTLRALGYTDPSRIPPNLVLPPPDVIMPTVSDLYQNFSRNWEDIIAAYYGYLRSLAETFNQTNYRMVQLFNAMNATFADVREKFLKVIIKDVNGTIWAQVEKLIPLWVSEAQEFYANQTNVLRGVMGALIQFANGTVKYVEIPAGWQIIPGAITTPNGQVPALVLQNWSGGLNPAYTPGNYTQPQMTTPASETIQVAMQLLTVILPLVLIVAVVRMIMDFGKGR